MRTCCHVAALPEKVANFSDTAATLSRKMTVALPRSSEAQNFRDFRDFRLYPHFQPGGVCATCLPTSPKVVQMLQNTETNPNVSGHGRILVRNGQKRPKRGSNPVFSNTGINPSVNGHVTDTATFWVRKRTRPRFGVRTRFFPAVSNFY